MIQAGVLALQGAFEPHLARLEDLGVAAREVRRASDLTGLTHLVLPGGESTTNHHLMSLFGLGEALMERWRDGSLVLFGTCAGAILLGRDDGVPPPRLGLLDAVFARNAYGRQVDSFEKPVALAALGPPAFPGMFIRAPKVKYFGPGAEVLGCDGADPVLVRGPGCLAATFHPELTSDLRIHRLFLEMHGNEPAQRSVFNTENTETTKPTRTVPPST